MRCRLIACCLLWLFAGALLAEPKPKQPQLLGLPRLNAAREASAAKIALGRKLFFDKRLSRDETVSCGSCHEPQRGWADGKPRAQGIGQQLGPRSSPSLLNTVYAKSFFWDGRAATLEEQIRGPIESPIEMGHQLPKLTAQLQALPAYAKAFAEVYQQEVTADDLIDALASFVRTLRAGNAPFDRYRAGDEKALSPAARRGHDVFFFRTNCSTCHRAPLFTDHEFHNLGIGLDSKEPDLGRFTVTQLDPDRHAFKTPSLRDVSRTAPYMHDGSLATLEKVVEFYADGGEMNPHLDPLMNIIPLSDQEQSDLVTFLREGLTSQDYPDQSSHGDPGD